MNHIGDTNKMVSDTPRTDEAYTASTGAGIYELFKKSQDIERELNAANAKIKRLEEAGEGAVKWIVDLINSGDAGFWNPEQESVIIAARAALKKEAK